MTDTPGVQPSKNRAILFAIIAAAVVVRLAFVTAVIGWNSAPSFLRDGTVGPTDEVGYNNYAYQYLTHGTPFGISWGPGEAGVLVLTYSVFGVNNYPVARFLSFLAATLAVWVIYLLAREIFQREDVALISAAVAVVYPPEVLLAGRMLSEPWFLLLMLVSLLFLLRAVKRDSWGYAIATGVAMGLAAYFRSIITYFPMLLLLGGIWLAFRGARKHAFLYVVPGLALALVVSPWIVRNYVYTGRFVLMASQLGHLTLVYHNRNSMEQWKRSHQIYSNDALAEALVTPEERQATHDVSRSSQEWRVRVDDIKLRKAKEWMRGHPGEEVQLLWPRFLTFYQFHLPEKAGKAHLAEFALQWLVAALAVPGLFVLKRFLKGIAWLPWVLVAPLALQFPLWPVERYRSAIDPFLAMLAAVAIVWLARRAPARETEPVAAVE